MEEKLVLQMDSIVKTFPGVKALDGVHLDVRRGEVHALCGENGAGKSTLMKIIAGAQGYTSGHMYVNGEEVVFHSTKDAERKGIAMIYQEFNMVRDLSVAENMYLGRLPKTPYGAVDWKKLYKDAQEELDRLGLKFDSRTKVRNLSVAESQMTEIAKCLTIGAKVIIMDEPTAALTDEEIRILFKIIAELKAEGISILYISHRMDEIKIITDRVTVMRDGEYVGTLVSKDCTKDDIINMMVGRTIYEDPKTESSVPADAPVVLKVEHLQAGKMVQDISFELRKGEILGFSGLMGAGRTETARVIFGADRKESGDIYVNGRKVEIHSPQDAVKAGIGYLSEDRKRYGVVLDKTIAENTTMASLEKFVKGIFINRKSEEATAQDYVERLNTKTPTVNTPTLSLSGGNQQKVVIAKWLVRDCDILIFDEPTRGIDVGAKSEIYHLMNEMAASGKSIIMISSELPEILRMSDRIMVMCEGKKTAEIPIEEASQEVIMQAATVGM